MTEPLINNESELHAALAALPAMADEQRNGVVCALIGHSKIIEMCFGYVHCGRCDVQIGDTLGSSFDATNYVIVGHNCETCQKNAANFTWRDTVFTPDPFADKVKS